MASDSASRLCTRLRDGGGMRTAPSLGGRGRIASPRTAPGIGNVSGDALGECDDEGEGESEGIAVVAATAASDGSGTVSEVWMFAFGDEEIGRS